MFANPLLCLHLVLSSPLSCAKVLLLGVQDNAAHYQPTLRKLVRPCLNAGAIAVFLNRLPKSALLSRAVEAVLKAEGRL